MEMFKSAQALKVFSNNYILRSHQSKKEGLNTKYPDAIQM